MKNRITELFNVDYPIVQGGLHGLALPELAAAVSEEGGLGLLSATCYDNQADFQEAIHLTRRLTKKSFGVNLTMGRRLDLEPLVKVALDEDIQIFFTSGRPPGHIGEMILNESKILVHVCTSIRHALKAQSLGASAVVLVGYEAAGHTGVDEVSTMVLIAKGSEVLDIPILAAGGIATGKGIIAALSLGAEGVQMGTRFLLTNECKAHSNVKRAYIHATEKDTLVVTRSYEKAHRVISSPGSKLVLHKEHAGETFEQIYPNVSGEAFNQVMATGNLDLGIVSAGQTIWLIHNVQTVKKVMEQLKVEMNRTLSHLNDCFNQDTSDFL